jgi:putative Holliday junction resolvase
MKNILGIDWGRAKVGLAWSAGMLAEPLEVIRFSEKQVLFSKLKEIAKDMDIQKIVIGISEGQSATETKEFGKEIEEALQIPVLYFDETLSSRDAQMYSQQAHIKRSKRKKMEDAYAASIMLQQYIDFVL